MHSPTWPRYDYTPYQSKGSICRIPSLSHIKVSFFSSKGLFVQTLTKFMLWKYQKKHYERAANSLFCHNVTKVRYFLKQLLKVRHMEKKPNRSLSHKIKHFSVKRDRNNVLNTYLLWKQHGCCSFTYLTSAVVSNSSKSRLCLGIFQFWSSTGNPLEGDTATRAVSSTLGCH